MKNMRARDVASVVLVSAISCMLGGCAATETLISKRNLVVESKTSTAIFVDPVSREKRTIYLDVKSGVDGFDRRAFKTFVMEQFVANENGYKLVDDPDVAQFTMVAYVLNLEQANPTAAQQALGQGYKGQAIVGGAIAGAVLGGTTKSLAAGGAAAGVAEHITGAFVHDVTFMLVCDIQIRETAAAGVLVQKATHIEAKVSDSGGTTQNVSETTNRKEYRTRIVTTANKANLDLADAQPLMFKKTAYAMSGFF